MDRISDTEYEGVGRTCHVTKSPDFNGYGFIIKSKTRTSDHYVSAVEKGSPAKKAGVCVGDRLITVNGSSVRQLAHKEVIERIHERPLEVELRLVGEEVDASMQMRTRQYNIIEDENKTGFNTLLYAVNNLNEAQTAAQQFVDLSSEKPIVGITTIDDQVFALVGQSAVQLIVLDASRDYSVRRHLSVPGVRLPIDLVSCSHQRLLYIADSDKDCIHVIAVIDVMMTSSTSDGDAEVKSIRWLVGGTPCGLAVLPSTGHLLVTCQGTTSVKEFSADGDLVREIDVGVARPYHAISLPTGHLVVGHGGAPDWIHGISVIDENTGKSVQMYGGRKGSQVGQLNTPWHIAVEQSPSIRSRLIYVADFKNGRVVTLSLNSVSLELEDAGELFSRERKDGWAWLPFRICLDSGRRTLYVCENNMSKQFDFSMSRIVIVRLQ